MFWKKKQPTKNELLKKIQLVELEMKEEWKSGCHGGFVYLENKLKKLQTQLKEVA